MECTIAMYSWQPARYVCMLFHNSWGSNPVVFCCQGDSRRDSHDDRTSFRDCIPESSKGTD